MACARRFDHESWLCPACGYAPALLDGRNAFAPEHAENSEGFEAGIFARLATLEASNFWFRGRNELLVWAIRKYFPNARAFLEIGCGTGFVLSALHEAFPEMSLRGSEIFSAGLREAQLRLPQAELFQMDARKLPFAEEFDLIGAFDVIEHVEADDLVLREMHRAVKRGGGILLTVPQHPWLWSKSDSLAHHVRRYTAAELVNKVRGSGFTVVWKTSFVTLLLPLMALSRRLRADDASFEPEAEFVSGWKNAVLERVMGAERLLIRAGCAFPVGGSLLLVARKD